MDHAPWRRRGGVTWGPHGDWRDIELRCSPCDAGARGATHRDESAADAPRRYARRAATSPAARSGAERATHLVSDIRDTTYRATYYI